jgi:hypothetical protein
VLRDRKRKKLQIESPMLPLNKLEGSGRQTRKGLNVELKTPLLIRLQVPGDRRTRSSSIDYNMQLLPVLAERGRQTRKGLNVELKTPLLIRLQVPGDRRTRSSRIDPYTLHMKEIGNKGYPKRVKIQGVNRMPDVIEKFAVMNQWCGKISGAVESAS